MYIHCSWYSRESDTLRQMFIERSQSGPPYLDAFVGTQSKNPPSLSDCSLFYH